MKNIILILILFFTSSAFSQEVYDLKLEVTSSMPFEEYSIHLQRNLKNTNVYIRRGTGKLNKISFKDSLRLQMLLDKNIMTPNRKDRLKLDSIIERYKIYECDSISLDIENPIINYADSITNSKSTFAEAKIRWENRVVIDGMSISLTVNCPDETFKYYFNSPNEKTFPLIYAFWKKIANYYNSNSEKKILEKDYFGE